MDLALRTPVVDALPTSDDPCRSEVAAGLPGVCPGRDDLLAEGEWAALLHRCREGDEAAFAEVVERCTDRLFNFLLRWSGHVQDAEDLVQETFLKAYRSLPRFDPSRSFLPWLFTIARRTALNHRRSRRPWGEGAGELPAEVPAEAPAGSPASSAADHEDTQLLWRLARRLKPKQYEVLWLCYGEGFSVAETAAVLNTNRLHVKVLLHRARQALLPLARRAGLGPPPPSP